ncbi:hypothetical protein JTE90_011635 [Oedothorax gibbosus]|uniref:LRRCT domain-containing protein n=1 Tax=Oedothorax gibbosus TaxID=931172 RepID=A0AAV6TRM6_9ARAC|nr:hypothetical protein JTE90_011635 [Oedothorax gibbosus]
MFPRGRNKLNAIDLQYNMISTLPNDMFSDMPALKYVYLAGNMIAVLPEATFQPVISQLFHLDVSGNSIKCDCLIAWMLQLKVPFGLRGNCYAPKALRGKEFDQLTRSDLHC